MTKESPLPVRALQRMPVKGIGLGVRLERLQVSVIVQTRDRGHGLYQAASTCRGTGCQHARPGLYNLHQEFHTAAEAGDRCQFRSMQLEAQP